MKRIVVTLVACLLVAASCATVRAQTSKLRVGFCARTLSSATAPFAIATKMGWYKQDGVEVDLVALAGRFRSPCRAWSRLRPLAPRG